MCFYGTNPKLWPGNYLKDHYKHICTNLKGLANFLTSFLKGLLIFIYFNFGSIMIIEQKCQQS